MTDKTQYCELCEAAQREIARLKASAFSNIETTRKAAKFLADLENVDAEIARLRGLIVWVWENHCGKDWALVCDQECAIEQIVKEERGEK